MTGKGPAEGGRSGTARNADLYCTARRTDGEPCQNYAVRGLDVCRFHGGSTPASVTVRQREEIKAIVEKTSGMTLPEIKPRDFAKVAAQMIAWNVKQFGELAQELETLRAEGAVVEHAREYGDLLDRLDKWGIQITKLMNAASGLKVYEQHETPPIDLLRAALAGIVARQNAGPNCHACGQRKPDWVAGEVVPLGPNYDRDTELFLAEEEGTLDDEIAEAMATLL